MDALNSFYGRAYSLIGSPAAREAFNIGAEPAALRDRYGRNSAGQRMLMARRLVEAGVTFVTVCLSGWDDHNKIKERISNRGPMYDQAAAALVTDLYQRGLDWDWESFGDYLGMIDRRLGVNVAAQVGHSALRYYVMGSESYERPATSIELSTMKEILRTSLLAGGAA